MARPAIRENTAVVASSSCRAGPPQARAPLAGSTPEMQHPVEISPCPQVWYAVSLEHGTASRHGQGSSGLVSDVPNLSRVCYTPVILEASVIHGTQERRLGTGPKEEQHGSAASWAWYVSGMEA